MLFVMEMHFVAVSLCLIDARKEIGLEVNTEKTKYMLLSNHDIKIGNRWFENVAQFKYLGTTITNENLIQEEIKRRLNSGIPFSPEPFVLSSAV
jgi:hypothetical protein